MREFILLNDGVKLELPDGTNCGDVSDGYHTFNELYKHRIILYIALCKLSNSFDVWRSKTHSDGTSYDGWFVLGIGYVDGFQISYHIPDEYWDYCDFALTLDKCPYDGHTSNDVPDRLIDKFIK